MDITTTSITTTATTTTTGRSSTTIPKSDISYENTIETIVTNNIETLDKIQSDGGDAGVIAIKKNSLKIFNLDSAYESEGTMI
jgi:hypothetical protein